MYKRQDLRVEQVQALRRGETIACPVYDFTVHNLSLIHISITVKPDLDDRDSLLAESQQRTITDLCNACLLYTSRCV